MPTIVKHRRGTTAQNAAFTGASGEISIDLDKMTLLIHDSATAGGFEMLSRNLTNQTIAGHMIPSADSTYNLGDSAAKWKDLYLSGNTIYLGDATISATGTAVTLPAGSTVAGTGFTLDSTGIYGILSAGTGVTYDGSGQFSIGQPVDSSANVNFATIQTTGNVTIGGDLTINGTTTTINSTTLDVDDLNITVAKGAADGTAANGAGLTVDGANATINYTSATDTWDFNKAFGTNTNVISNYTTTQLSEGNNLYYTRARFDSALGDATSQSTIRGYFSAAGDLSYNSSTGEFSFDVENVYTQANFDSDFNTALDATNIGGTGLAYNSSTNVISIDSAELTSSYSAPIRSLFSAGGDLTYNSSTGQFSFDVESVYTQANFDSDFNTSLDAAAIGGKGLAYNTADNTLSIDSAELYAQYKHDDFSDYVADEHVAHSGVSITAGSGLTGGGDITTTRTLNVVGGKGIAANADDIQIDSAELYAQYKHDDFSDYVADEHVAHSGVTITAGAGLTGGGDITTSRTIDVVGSAGVVVNADNIAIDSAHIRTLFSGSAGVNYNSSTGAFDVDEANVVHDNLSGFVADEHVAHTSVTLTAGTGLNGGGDISASRTFNIDSAELYASFAHDDFHDYVADEHVAHSGVTITAGSGLTGGGDITTSRTLNIGQGTGITVSADEISTNDGQIVHDNLSGFVANEHVDHTGVTLTAGIGLNGGGDISTGRTFNIDSAELYGHFDHDSFRDYVADEHVAHSSVSITAGSGLTGGGTIAATRTLNIGQGTGITVSADEISTNDAQIVHDNLSGFVADEHIAHTGVTLTAGTGLNGGGNISASRTFNIDSAELYASFAHDDFHDYVANEHIDHTTVSITAGSGLTGGGTIASTRTLNIGEGTGITVSADAISTNDAEIVHDNLSGFVADEHIAHSSVSLTAGAGLTGGGTIAASRTFNVGAGTGVTVNADNVAIGQPVDSAADVIFNSVETTANLVVGGNLQVLGDTTTVSSSSLEVEDNMIYMNTGIADSAGAPVIATDVGWAAGVNDNSVYEHVGMFRDASDDRFKVFKGYTPEPDAALEINTGHASFALADFQASTFYGNLTGNVTGNLTGDVTGNASTATTLETARTIGGVSFNGSANINLPGVNTAGNQNTSGNAATATKLATGRTIGLSGDVTATGVSFDGTGNITLTTAMAANSVDLTTHTTGNYVAAGATSGNGISGSVSSEGGTFTVTSNATNANTGSTIVYRDGSGNFSAGTITAALSGNATTATTLQTGRDFSISGDITASAVSFDGSGNVTLSAAITAGSIVNADINASAAIADTKLATISTSGKVANSATTATSANTGSAIVARDGNGDFTARHVTLASGDLKLDEYVLNSQTATTSSTSQTAVATFAAATYGSAEIVVTAKDGTARHISKLLVVHNGTTADATEFGTITTGSSLATYEVDINGGNVRLLATPASSNSTVFNVALTLIDA